MICIFTCTGTAQGDLCKSSLTQDGISEAFQGFSEMWPNSFYFTYSMHCTDNCPWKWFSMSRKCLGKVGRRCGSGTHSLWPSVHESHNNDGCLQEALTPRLHCITNHRYMDEGLFLLTCKEIGLFQKSTPPKNINSFSLYYRRLGSLNFNNTTGVPQSFALFTTDQVSLL